MKRTWTILKASVAGLFLAVVMSLAGCGDGGRHHISYRHRDGYPTYSRSHDGGRDKHAYGGWDARARDGRGFASRDDGWRRR